MKFKKLATALAVSCATFTMLNTMTAQASSHREAPAITERPKVDSTDLYMFNSYEASRIDEEGNGDYVTILANVQPIQLPGGGPNYFSLDRDALYEIHIDNDGDAVEDITYQFRFKNTLKDRTGPTVTVGGRTLSAPLKTIAPISAADSSALNFNESYTLTVIEGNRRRGSKTRIANPAGGNNFTKPYDNVGDKTFDQGYKAYADQYIYDGLELPNCSAPAKVFVGQRKESFAVNLGKTFDLVNYTPIKTEFLGGAGGIAQDKANNTLENKNITTIALEIPKTCLTGGGTNTVVGAWMTSSLRQVSILNPRASFRFPEINGGAWVQVSRLGMPLVNELVIGLEDKDRFNSSHPRNDGQFGKYVTNPTLPLILDVLFNAPVNGALGNVTPVNIAPTNFPRNDLVATFLTGFAGVNQLPTVTASDMLRLNTAIPAVPAEQQVSLGVAAGDVAGFPNGRRPGDDVVDVALRVSMGALCYDLPLGTPDSNGVPAGVNLGLCAPADASTGFIPYTDGAPMSAADFDSSFPYLTTPISGSN